ncbi:MAG: hypothetical protein U5N26_03030 [Candidatus Marinimicrobia bacterium]|nr:hypothetical protein [Candidatus Neomarinimicrobiota bacterium]
MKFLKVFSIILVVLVVLFILIGIFLPKTASLKRDITIQASSRAVTDKIVALYEDHFWPIWERDDTTMVFYPLESGNGYRWEGNKVAQGECEYTVDLDNTIRDNIRFQGRDVAGTTWRLEGSSPTELHVTFTVKAGGNLGTRWTNLFIEPLSGTAIDQILDGMKEELESDGLKKGTP